MVNNVISGKMREIMAAKYLTKKKYKIIETNYKTKLGEIDIIAKYKNTTVFVEVKYRATAKFGMPAEAVTTYKQHKIRLVAMEYLQSHRLIDSMVRFDVIDILENNITHIENAF